jgi:hypothetical protein
MMVPGEPAEHGCCRPAQEWYDRIGPGHAVTANMPADRPIAALGLWVLTAHELA